MQGGSKAAVGRLQLGRWSSGLNGFRHRFSLHWQCVEPSLLREIRAILPDNFVQMWQTEMETGDSPIDYIEPDGNVTST